MMKFSQTGHALIEYMIIGLIITTALMVPVKTSSGDEPLYQAFSHQFINHIQAWDFGMTLAD